LPESACCARGQKGQGEHSYVIVIEIKMSFKFYPTWRANWNELLRYYGSVWYYISEEIKLSFEEALKRYQNEKSAYDVPGEAVRQRIYVYDLMQTL
jgi:hypothetical protein